MGREKKYKDIERIKTYDRKVRWKDNIKIKRSNENYKKRKESKRDEKVGRLCAICISIHAIFPIK